LNELLGRQMPQKRTKHGGLRHEKRMGQREKEDKADANQDAPNQWAKL
jgi:hypothetical protein